MGLCPHTAGSKHSPEADKSKALCRRTCRRKKTWTAGCPSVRNRSTHAYNFTADSAAGDWEECHPGHGRAGSFSDPSGLGGHPRLHFPPVGWDVEGFLYLTAVGRQQRTGGQCRNRCTGKLVATRAAFQRRRSIMFAGTSLDAATGCKGSRHVGSAPRDPITRSTSSYAAGKPFATKRFTWPKCCESRTSQKATSEKG